MKRIVFLLVLSITVIAVQSQTNFTTGSLVTSKNESMNESIRISKGKLTTQSGKSYRADELKSFTIQSANYISYENDFYKEITTGKLVTLYQKVTDNRNERIFNGAEVVGFAQTTSGGVGDYYILTSSTGKLDFVNKKNFKSYFLKMINGHDSLAAQIVSGSLGYAQIKEVTDKYNSELSST